MASSRKSAPADPSAVVQAAVGAALSEHVAPGARVAVALSGGIDSMVLLDALSAAAPGHPCTLSAVHVHHGLSPSAERWAAFCAEQCGARGVPLTVHRLDLKHERGQSLEAVARAARYERLLATDVDVAALAHHADDQAETVLLQLLRGAGPPGLAAMPLYRDGRPALLRPLLQLTRATLIGCANARGLKWIDDESNANTAHKRNLLRSQVAPIFAAHFAGYPGTLARAARHQAEAAQLQDELAALDAADAADAQGLERTRLAALSPARARNLLRWFLRREGLRPPSDARLAEMLRQLLGASDDAHTRIAHDATEIGCYRGRVVVHPPSVAPFACVWRGEAELRLPGGTLAFERVRGLGLCADKLSRAPVTLRARAGGERIQLALDRPHHALKKLLQQAGLPAWDRDALPLVWCGDDLAAVPGVGVALAFQCAPGEPGWQVAWYRGRYAAY